MRPIFLFLTTFLLTISNYAATVELEWKMKDDTNVVGYSFTVWMESGVAVTTKLGKINSVKIDTLKEGQRYVFQITPLTKYGASGEKSNFIIYDAPSTRAVEINGKPELRLKSSK